MMLIFPVIVLSIAVPVLGVLLWFQQLDIRNLEERQRRHTITRANNLQVYIDNLHRQLEKLDERFEFFCEEYGFRVVWDEGYLLEEIEEEEDESENAYED